MKIGSKLIIYSISKKSQVNGKKFYIGIFIEKVYNSYRRDKNKWEYTKQPALFSTDLDVEEAKFDLGVSEDQYSCENISNPEKSIFRVLDFSVTTVTKWKRGKQVFNKYHKPETALKYTITKMCRDKDFVSEEKQIGILNRKIKSLEAQVEKYKAMNSELRQKNALKGQQVKYRDKLVENEKKKAERAKRRLNTVIETQKHIQINKERAENASIKFEEI
jgi:hypothetical protein